MLTRQDNVEIALSFDSKQSVELLEANSISLSEPRSLRQVGVWAGNSACRLSSLPLQLQGFDALAIDLGRISKNMKHFPIKWIKILYNKWKWTYLKFLKIVLK